MSSAILYVAIVAIWAVVLIPRWLRRDSGASGRDSEGVAPAEAETEAGSEAGISAEVARETAPPLRRREGGAGSEARPARREERSASRPMAAARPAPDPAPAVPAPVPARAVPARAEARKETPVEVSRGGRDQDYQKVLSARRRLLGMLLVLAIAAGALAYTKMAAWWVVVPPTVMLLGYMALLHEAGKADVERRELAGARAAAAEAAAAAVAAAKRAAPPAPAAPASVPNAEIIDISASLTVAGHKFYDQYADAKLRAVGD